MTPDTRSTTASSRSGVPSRSEATPRPTSSSRPRPSVIFVREWEQQMSSSGCCGRVEGDFLDFGRPGGSDPGRREEPEVGGGGAPHVSRERVRVFAERRKEMEEVGVLYRAVRDRFGDDVDIRVVDPRNLLSLIPILWQEGGRHGVPVGETLRSMLRLSVNMLIVNGRIVGRNDWPDAGELLERIERSRGRESVSGTAPRDRTARRA